jgi:hypothetical protein
LKKVFPLNGIYLLTMLAQNGQSTAAVTLAPAVGPRLPYRWAEG